MQILSIFAQLPLLSSMYSQVLVKTCPYARSPPNFPHSEMTAQGAPIGSNFLVRADPSPGIDSEQMTARGEETALYKQFYKIGVSQGDKISRGAIGGSGGENLFLFYAVCFGLAA